MQAHLKSLALSPRNVPKSYLHWKIEQWEAYYTILAFNFWPGEVLYFLLRLCMPRTGIRLGSKSGWVKHRAVWSDLMADFALTWFSLFQSELSCSPVTISIPVLHHSFTTWSWMGVTGSRMWLWRGCVYRCWFLVGLLGMSSIVVISVQGYPALLVRFLTEMN